MNDAIKTYNIAQKIIMDAPVPLLRIYTTAESGPSHMITLIGFNLKPVPNLSITGVTARSNASPEMDVVKALNHTLNLLQTSGSPIVPWSIVPLVIHSGVIQMCVLVQPDAEHGAFIRWAFANLAPEGAQVLVLLPVLLGEAEHLESEAVRSQQKQAVREMCGIEHATPTALTLERQFGGSSPNLVYGVAVADLD